MTQQQLKQIADATIPPATGKEDLIKKRYRTNDIVAEIFSCFESSRNQLKNFAPYLQGDNLYDTCFNIWKFLKENVKYRVDPEGDQWVKTPARVWHDKVCDCKSYSIFIASVLYNLGIKGCFRFVSFDNTDPNPTHVYVVVRNQGKNILIDAVMPRFDAEKQYASKKDYSMSGLYRVSGLPETTAAGRKPNDRLPVVGCACQQPAVGRFGPNPKNKGKFTEKARRHGMNAQQFADYVLAHNSRFPDKTIWEADFVRNARYFRHKHHVSGLPVVSSGEIGNIGDLLSPLKKLLTGSKAKDVIIQMAPALLYLYLPTNGGWFNNPNAASFFNSLPAAVRNKTENVRLFMQYAHEQWGWAYDKLGPLVHHTLVQTLGMEPQHYLALTINSVIDSYKNNTVNAVGSIGIINWGQTAGGVASGAASGAATAGPAGAAAGGALSLLTGIFSGLSSVTIPAQYQPTNIGPLPADWNGYQTRVPLGVVNPTLQDPLGAGINNGIYDANGNPTPQATQQNNVPVVNQQGQVVNTPTATQSSMSPIIIIGLAGAAAMMLFHKKKKKK